jgi:hypothetical protein
MANAEEKSMRRDLGRLRVFAFVAVSLAALTIGIINEESDILLHALDEYAIFALSIVVILLVIVWRNKRTLADLKMQLNVYEVLFLIMLFFKIFGFTQEMSDPTDFGDEIPLLIILILTVIQRFV